MRKQVYCAMLIGVMLLAGCGSAATDATKPSAETTTAVETESDSTEQQEITETEETNDEIKYSDDEIVNRFIVGFAEIAGYELTNISEGNIRTKYHCHAGNAYLELLNATENTAETFNVSYGFDDLSQEEIYSLLTDCLMTLGATNDEISKTIDDLTVNNKGDYLIEDYPVNDAITVTYCPTKELSNGSSVGHIEMASLTYGK